MPRCYFVKKPIQQYSNFTILNGTTTTMENEKLVKGTTTSSSIGNTASVIVAISSSQAAVTKASPSQSTGLCQYICASTNVRESQESRNGK